MVARNGNADENGKQEGLTHGERHATRFDFTQTKMPSTRDRRRTRRVSAAVLTDMASTAAVCLWVAQLCRLRHRQLQGSADDADPILRTSPPNRSESGEDDFAHEKNQGIRSAASAVGTRCRSAERVTQRPTPAGQLRPPGHLPPHRECHE